MVNHLNELKEKILISGNLVVRDQPTENTTKNDTDIKPMVVIKQPN